MRSGAMLGGGGRLSAPSSFGSMVPSAAPARQSYAAARASGARSARVVAAAGADSSIRTALRARGSSLPAALRAGRAPMTSSASSSATRRSLVVKAVFERFTERAIKAVMLSQTEAKNLGSSEVRCVLLLKGVGGGKEEAGAKAGAPPWIFFNDKRRTAERETKRARAFFCSLRKKTHLRRWSSAFLALRSQLLPAREPRARLLETIERGGLRGDRAQGPRRGLPQLLSMVVCSFAFVNENGEMRASEKSSKRTTSRARKKKSNAPLTQRSLPPAPTHHHQNNTRSAPSTCSWASSARRPARRRTRPGTSASRR